MKEYDPSAAVTAVGSPGSRMPLSWRSRKRVLPASPGSPVAPAVAVEVVIDGPGKGRRHGLEPEVLAAVGLAGSRVQRVVAAGGRGHLISRVRHHTEGVVPGGDVGQGIRAIRGGDGGRVAIVVVAIPLEVEEDGPAGHPRLTSLADAVIVAVEIDRPANGRVRNREVRRKAVARDVGVQGDDRIIARRER